MPILFIFPIVAIVLIFVIYKFVPVNNIKFEKRSNVILSLIIWCCLIYQFVSIASYVDDFGVEFCDVIGEYGLIVLWLGLITSTLQILWSISKIIKK